MFSCCLHLQPFAFKVKSSSDLDALHGFMWFILFLLPTHTPCQCLMPSFPSSLSPSSYHSISLVSCYSSIRPQRKNYSPYIPFPWDPQTLTAPGYFSSMRLSQLVNANQKTDLADYSADVFPLHSTGGPVRSDHIRLTIVDYLAQSLYITAVWWIFVQKNVFVWAKCRAHEKKLLC